MEKRVSYGKEKLIIETRIGEIKKKVFAVVLAFILALCLFSVFIPADTWKYYVALPEVKKRAAGELRMHFIDVGQGDATLIELPDGKTMLVDGGNGSDKTATTILRYCNALKIKRIDYLLLTHADSDHCGGLDTIVRYKKIGRAFLPKVSETVNAEFAEFYAALQEKDCPMEYASRDIKLYSSNEDYPFNLSFLYPYTIETEELVKTETESNLLSAIFWLDYFGVSALFTGDAPFAIEEKLMRDSDFGFFNPRDVELGSTEILKVAHHGSKYSTSTEFLKYLGVQVGVISCSEYNLYNHPSSEVLERLQTENVKEYITYRNGHVMITVTPDGEYKVETMKS